MTNKDKIIILAFIGVLLICAITVVFNAHQIYKNNYEIEQPKIVEVPKSRIQTVVSPLRLCDWSNVRILYDTLTQQEFLVIEQYKGGIAIAKLR